MRASRIWLGLGYALACAGVGCGDDSADDGRPTLPVDGGRGGAAGAAGAAGSSQGGAAGGAAGTSGATGGNAARGGAGAGGDAGRTSSGGRGGRGGRPGSGGAGGMSGSGAMGGAMAGGGAGTCAQELRCKLTAPPSSGDPHQDCVDRINQFRMECACLPPLQRWTEGEACADMMAEYDSSRPNAHAGFMDGICEGGSAQNECPGWRSNDMIIQGCLQSMWDEGPPPTPMCSGQCFQTYGHFINMTSTRSTKVACGFFTTSNGRIWSVQNFSR